MSDKGLPVSHNNGISGVLSLAPPSMLRETSLSRELSFAFGSTLSNLNASIQPPVELDMPSLSRNHSLFGYLEVPSLPRNPSSSLSLTMAYEDPFGGSPRGENTT